MLSIAPSRTSLGVVMLALSLVACAPPNPAETAAAPVVAGTRRAEIVPGEHGMSADQRGSDAIVVGKVTGTAEAVWAALKAAFDTRKVNLTILDRGAGRMGDTSLTMIRRWNGQAVSRYLSCGSTLTGLKADDERIRGVLLAQLTKMQADTIAVAVHFSGTSTPIASGTAGSSSACTSTGRAEQELIADVTRRVTGAK